MPVSEPPIDRAVCYALFCVGFVFSAYCLGGSHVVTLEQMIGDVISRYVYHNLVIFFFFFSADGLSFFKAGLF